MDVQNAERQPCQKRIRQTCLQSDADSWSCSLESMKLQDQEAEVKLLGPAKRITTPVGFSSLSQHQLEQHRDAISVCPTLSSLHTKPSFSFIHIILISNLERQAQ